MLSTKQELTEAGGGNILWFSILIHIDNCNFVMKTLSIWYAKITIWRRCEKLALDRLYETATMFFFFFIFMVPCIVTLY